MMPIGNISSRNFWRGQKATAVVINSSLGEEAAKMEAVEARAERPQEVGYQLLLLGLLVADRVIWSFEVLIDHSSQYFNFSPPGGTDTDKPNSSAQLALVCLSQCHLTAINGTKDKVIYSWECGRVIWYSVWRQESFENWFVFCGEKFFLFYICLLISFVLSGGRQTFDYIRV